MIGRDTKNRSTCPWKGGYVGFMVLASQKKPMKSSVVSFVEKRTQTRLMLKRITIQLVKSGTFVSVLSTEKIIWFSTCDWSTALSLQIGQCLAGCCQYLMSVPGADSVALQ